MGKKTKIIATLGPSSSSADDILLLIEAGMDIARINLSHGERVSHSELIRNIKKARKRAGKPTGILLDTRGPEIRVGELVDPVYLIEGRTVKVSGTIERSSAEVLAVSHAGIAGDVKVGNTMLLDDGKMVLKVEDVEGDYIHARVVVGGLLTSRKRLSLPGVDVGLPSITEKDRADILFGIDQQVDYIAASFVRKSEDVLAIREIVGGHGGCQGIISKIENRQGVNNLKEILAESDGLMVARGDLGVEVAAEEVPVIQKRIIRAANRVGKPVITATQMLESMINNPAPTRAEASDVTNAVMDGSDAVMLSGETAMGKYPLDAVRFLARCTEITETAIDYRAKLSEGLRRNRHIVSDAIAYASCAIAADLSVAAILSITTSGSTARKVAMYRPRSPVIALSPRVETLRKLQLVRGVIPVRCESGASMDEQIKNGVQAAVQEGYLGEQDTIAITGGLPMQATGVTNILRVHTIGEDMSLL